MKATPLINNLNRASGQLRLNADQLDAFGRVKVSEPTTIFESQFQYNKMPLLWNEATQGGGSAATHSSSDSTIDFACGAADGDYVIRQSKQYIRYQPGKSQLIPLTGVLGAAKAGVVKRMGLFDANDGLFLEQNETTPALVVRNSASDTAIPQASWNLDSLDGTGASGVVLDLTKAQILVIDFQWLGVGDVRFGFDVAGQVHWVHTERHSNIVTTTYMTSPNLPIRYEIRNTAATTATTDMKQICSAVMSEGGIDRPLSFPWSAHSSLITPVTASATLYTPVISLQLATLVNSIANRGQVFPISSSLIVTSASTVFWGLVLNGTLTGSAFAAVDTDSIAQVDTTATAISTGQLIASGFASATNKGGAPVNPSIDLARLLMSRNIDNTDSDVITLVAQGVGGTADVHGAMSWREAY